MKAFKSLVALLMVGILVFLVSIVLIPEAFQELLMQKSFMTSVTIPVTT